MVWDDIDFEVGNYRSPVFYPNASKKEKNKKKATVELVPLLVLVEVPMFAQHQLWALDGTLVSAIS